MLIRLDINYYNAANNNRYLYNGKEQQFDLTDQYDYGARFYDPIVIRWTSVDPKIEDDHQAWTPYSYVYDNAIRFNDPDGRDTTGYTNPRYYRDETYGTGPLGKPTPDISLDDVQGLADKVSDASSAGELLGLGISAAGFPEVGGPIIKVSSTVGSVASVTSGVIDIAKGNGAKGAVKIAAVAISEAVGGLIKKSDAKAGAKVALNAAKVVADKVVDLAINTTPSAAHSKNLSTTPTMQQDATKKQTPPPKLATASTPKNNNNGD
jgi:RHS repeat-associated protein